MADAWYVGLSNMTGYFVYNVYTPGCYSVPRFYESQFNQAAYAATMVYYYESNDCSGYHSVHSKSNSGWLNVYHPIRTFRIHNIDH
ncbi:hypothetical protein IWQ57_002485 [Coemansia nantahalensis]|uniref:Uncharacterized protein n=2 Tax=Coemansia TaxID=4863 RepID=A0ACC1LBY4_9FUNG|nr:hypothetical protein IWQ57_002485 [Coemansia nantahalensis]KAJ2804963.1 hypothetical protein H4R21_001437 [Coemansia helicoidea]